MKTSTSDSKTKLVLEAVRVSLTAVAAAALVAAVLLLAHKFGDREKGTKGLKIDDTEVILQEIRKMSRFTTGCFYEETVVTDRREKSYLGPDEICIIAKGTLRAGYDLDKMKGDDIRVSNDTVSILLPTLEIFDVTVNPSDCEIYVQEGEWSHEEIRSLLLKAQNKIRQDAVNDNVLEKAKESGESQMRELLGSLGFRTVEFR